MLCLHVAASRSAPAICCLLIHVGHRRSPLASSHRLRRLVGLRTVFATYCPWIISALGCACTHKGSLTSTSFVPGVSLYGHSVQYDTCFIASLSTNIPALSSPTGDTKQRAGSACWFPLATFFLSLQRQLALTKPSTCMVRISSLEAL